MDTPTVSNASTASTSSLSRSQQAAHPSPLGNLQSPIDPPCRRSSLGFSQILSPKPQVPAPVAQTPNIGRKRGNIQSLLRSKATPGHNANMQKIFDDAKAHLQLDMAFASSPRGSIESRLPSGQTPSLSEASSRSVSARQDDVASKTRDWRYSTAPGLLAYTHIDVREPVPESEPLLPEVAFTRGNPLDSPAPEPVSSGFNTPYDHNMHDESTENDPMLLPLPEPSPLTSKFVDIEAMVSRYSSPSPCPEPPRLTTLEGPLTGMEINDACDDPAGDNDLSPVIAFLRTQPPSLKMQDATGEESSSESIILSTPAKAAGESARAKRGFQKSDHRSTSGKENIPPRMICPDPSVHTDPRVTRCPDPRLHDHEYGPQVRMNTPSPIGVHSGNATPNSYFNNYRPSPSPLRASLCPPVPHYRRTDSTGSPLPFFKVKSPPNSPGQTALHQRQSYISPRHTGHHPPITAFPRPPTGVGRPSPDAEHFRPGWYNYPAGTEPPKPKSLTYAFSTAAAKVVGSSQRPDLRIRDSYRTDTLTPLARPANRFRKNGIGAIVAREANRSQLFGKYTPWPSTNGPGNGRPGTAYPPRRSGMASPDPVLFTSSPPRQPDHSIGVPMRRWRPKVASRDFCIAEDSTATSIPGTPMVVDEDIRAAVRLSIVGVPDTPVDSIPSSTEVKPLSPHVSPFRKGKGVQVKRPRTTSYWDHDLPEVRKIDQARMKRPATMDAGPTRVKSIRLSGIKSSPPRQNPPSRAGETGKAPTVASASVYSQAGMSDMSRPATRAKRSDEKLSKEKDDEEMGGIAEADGMSD